MILAFPTAGGLSLLQTETLSLSPGIFIVIQSTPLASSLSYPKTSHLSFSKGQCQMQILHHGIPQVAGFFPGKFCLGVAPLGISQTLFTYCKEKVLMTKGR